MTVDSSPGQGTTFRVFLPRLDEPRGVPAEPERPDPPIAGRPVGTL